MTPCPMCGGQLDEFVAVRTFLICTTPTCEWFRFGAPAPNYKHLVVPPQRTAETRPGNG